MKFVDKATGNVTNSKGYAFVDYDKHEDALCKLFLSFSVFFFSLRCECEKKRFSAIFNLNVSICMLDN